VGLEVLPGLEIVSTEHHQSRVAVGSLAELEHSLVACAPLDTVWKLFEADEVSVEACINACLVTSKLIDSMLEQELVVLVM
jgi:hypothetical protein